MSGTTGFGTRRVVSAGETTAQRLLDNPTTLPAGLFGSPPGGESGLNPTPQFSAVAAWMMMWDALAGADTTLRTPGIYKFNAFATGAGGIWTPAAGKKFRLMGWVYTITSNAIQAVAGIESIRLTDGGTNIGTAADCFVPGAAGPTGPALLWWLEILPGNGYISSAANNTLGSTITNNLTGGEGMCHAFGTEE